MTQTLAIFLDAYRELNARKLFWITLALSGLVVGVFAMIGINEDGVSVLFWTLPMGMNSTVVSPDLFYKSIFADLGIGLWLSIAATVLALVTTAGIIPDLVAGGSIDLMLSKPISRVRLFLTKYLTGLLFMALQVTVFCVASFLVMGWRGGSWEPGLFVAIPLVVCFYSYLFAICATLGLVTQSTIASLMLTMLAWIMIFSIHAGESTINLVKIAAEQEVMLVEHDIEQREALLVHAKRQGAAGGPRRVEVLENALEQRLIELEAKSSSRSTWRGIHRSVMVLKTLMPKTSETIGLLERQLIDLADLPEAQAPQPPLVSLHTGNVESIKISILDPSVVAQVTLESRERSVGWIIGSSLGFEAFLLAIGSWLFWRRDF